MNKDLSLEQLQKAIFGETVKDFSLQDLENWKKNAISQLENIKNGLKYDEYVINDIINYLNNTDTLKREFTIKDKTISIEELETLYNFMYAKENSFDDYLAMVKENTQEKTQRLLDFYNDIVKDNISVTICDNREELIFHLFVDGCDNQQLIDNFNFLINKLEKMQKYDLEKIENVLKIGNRYFLLQW